MKKNHCDRPPTNAEVVARIIFRVLNDVEKLFKFFAKNKLITTFWALSCCVAGLIFVAKLSFNDFLEGAKFLITLL